MPILNYHNKKFRPVSNTENGETSADTLFHYQQHGNILSASYAGGQIIKGQLIGLVSEAGNINMRYQQINNSGEIMTGICHSKPVFLPDGRIQLHEKWQWTSGDRSQGTSILEEVRE